MSHWISVYCQKPIKNLSASILEKEIRRGCTDYRGYEYFDDMFAFVKVKEFARKEEQSSLFHLTYKLKAKTSAAGKAPIVLESIVKPEVVQGMVQEQLEEYLKRRRGPKVAHVRKHLAKVAAIYSFCLKVGHCENEGRIVVCSAREFLAGEGKGMVREDGVGWLKWTRYGLFEALKE